jgi:hypothetical protein
VTTIEATIITAIVSGVFGVGAGVLTWRLKSSTDEKNRAVAKLKEHREEVKALYTSIFVSLEQAIRHVHAEEAFVVDKELSEVNGKVQLLASEAVASRYSEAAALLQKWSRLYALASPRKMTVGDKTVILFQAPDPTAKYKQPASEAHEELQTSLSELVQTMRSELADAT